jgi:ATP-dependent Clp protease ATP-binding subunit ClpC
MLEGFTEKACRVIFFARYEASQLGSESIEPEHLLLGLLREDTGISARFIGPFSEIEAIRKQIVDRTNRGEKLSTSVDRPLSRTSKAVLAQADKERVRLGVARVGTEHVLLGLLQQESLAAEVLGGRGVKAQSVLERLETLPKTTACKDCRHLINAGGASQLRLDLYCGASPIEPRFDCYSGEFKRGATDRPEDQYQACTLVNFGDCNLFEPKQEHPPTA